METDSKLQQDRGPSSSERLGCVSADRYASEGGRGDPEWCRAQLVRTRRGQALRIEPRAGRYFNGEMPFFS